MTDKAYIVANEQQEHEVLEKLEREGVTWIIDRKPTEQMPSSNSFAEFPYVLFSRNRLSWGFIESLSDEEIVYDGRKEERMSEKYVVSQEFMNKLRDWKLNTVDGVFINDDDIEDLPYIIVDWWVEEPSDEENNNRLIAIIRWVNGEDVFEVEKPKKWVVRDKVKDVEGDYWYVLVEKDYGVEYTSRHTLYSNNYTKFDTKEEAESWANAHQEVVEVVDV